MYNHLRNNSLRAELSISSLWISIWPPKIWSAYNALIINQLRWIIRRSIPDGCRQLLFLTSVQAHQTTAPLNVLKIKETCLYSQDLDTLRAFYHGVLRFPIISELPGKHIFFRVGESVLLCFNPDYSRSKKSPPPHFAEGKYHVAFEVRKEDYAKYKLESIDKGIEITDRVIWHTGQESFYFEDPAGNVLEIIPEGIWD
ncbi:MAG: VOC family protein [Cytophagales bacterium]|nr:VOC family protein [Cytophagales bacterium]